MSRSIENMIALIDKIPDEPAKKKNSFCPN